MSYDLDLFTLGLGLRAPWHVGSASFDSDHGGLCLELACDEDSSHSCPHCHRVCPCYDRVSREWRHMNFWQHETHLRAQVPRVSCAEHGVVTTEVPWSRPGSGFTLLLEAFVLRLAKDMPMAAVSRIMGIPDGRLWRIVSHYVDQARDRLSQAEVTRIGVDETSANAKTPFITVVVDLDQRRVLFATPGKDGDTIKEFTSDLKSHGGDAAHITDVSCDMSQAYTAAVGRYLPSAAITYDRFHVTKLVTDALDEVRRSEVQTGGMTGLLVGTRFALLKNESNQTASQAVAAKVIALPQLHLKTGKAYRMKLAFQAAYALPGEQGIAALSAWCSWAQRSRLPDFMRVARTLRAHWDGVIAAFTTGITNAILEGINSLIQAAKSRARGYRNVEYLITMVYLIAGKLPLPALK